jgi:multicomponent Na+:H+ antiporter subunit D
MRALGADRLALAAASVTIVGGSLLALAQNNLKARLAFSTVSQLSYIILGASLLNPKGVMGGTAHITNHAVSKITLFFCAGSIYVSTHKTEISEMSGLARRVPWTMAAFALSSLSIVGIPLTSGFVSKWYLALGAVDSHSLIVLSVILLSSLLGAAYLGQILYKAYFEREDEPPHENVREVPWMIAPLAISAAASLLLGLFPGPVLGLAGRIMP